MNKKRFILTIIKINIAILFLIQFAGQVSAIGAILDFSEEPTYECYRANDKGYYYHINFKIKNSADEYSCPIDIRIYEEDMKAASNESSSLGVVFAPNEEKTFTIEWATLYNEKEIEIKFAPSNLNNITNNNYGSTSLNVIYGESTSKDTPGFSIIILMIAFLIYLFVKKIKK